MAYTPINWQTGDTITAEKMNKMDNGWGVQNTQLFSESVTTEDFDGVIKSNLDYSAPIDYDSIAVTFNGTDYSCSRIDAFDAYFYGEFTEQGPDFTVFPFLIQSDREGANIIFTESAGTYTISVNVPHVETSDAFASAVVHAEEFAVVSGVTTFQEAADAFKSGKRVYVTDDSQNNKTYHQPIILINESTYEIKFISTSNNDTSVILSGLSASSADGVLS